MDETRSAIHGQQERPALPPRLQLVDQAWEGTRLPLYQPLHGLAVRLLSAGSRTPEELADAAREDGLGECMIQVTRTVTRGEREVAQRALYYWQPEERRVQRVPQHSVQTLIRELGGEDQDERRATG